MSTLRKSLLLCDDVKSVKSFNISRSIFTPSSVAILHFLDKSFSIRSPVLLSATIFTFFESRILQMVEVDSWFLALKILIPKILLTNVDFPALVSPEKINQNALQNYFFCIVAAKNFKNFQTEMIANWLYKLEFNGYMSRRKKHLRCHFCLKCQRLHFVPFTKALKTFI